MQGERVVKIARQYGRRDDVARKVNLRQCGETLEIGKNVLQRRDVVVSHVESGRVLEQAQSRVRNVRVIIGRYDQLIVFGRLINVVRGKIRIQLSRRITRKYERVAPNARRYRYRKLLRQTIVRRMRFLHQQT